VAALWHAIGHFAKLHANRKDLKDDTRYRCDLRIVGTVGSYPIDEPINGTLCVSGPQEKASSTSVPTAEVVAWLWDQVPKTRWADLREEAVAHFSATGELPPVETRDLEAAKLWLKQLRATKTTRSEGAVTFELDPEPGQLRAA
jgi:hypothetical protein